MKFTKYDLGFCERGQIVEIRLTGSAANVQLMDGSNLSNYKSGKKYQYFGGLAKHSPVKLPIPHSGFWYVVIDMRGLVGTVKSSVKVLSGSPMPLPEIPLSTIPSLVHHHTLTDKIEFNPEYDVFISHASEDKDEIVRPLALALKNNGLIVWYDEFELHIGDSLRRKIDQGLANSKFGIVVLSQNFFKKGWTQYELDGIVTRAVTGEQVILPIWHNISKKEVMDFSPSLADKVARNTSTHTIDEIADEIAGLINKE